MMRLFVICNLLCISLALVQESQASDKNYLDTTGEKKPLPEDGTLPAQVVAPKPIVRLNENDAAVFSVRCWQNGQLILEETNWSAPQVSERFVAMRKVGSPSPGIYLIDFQHTFCELKQR